MKYYQITITSKNKQSLKDYSKFFIDNFKNFSKHSNKIKKKKLISILKSPHVNKKAQEQFEFIVFSKIITLQTPNNYQFLFILKKIETNIFLDVNIKIKLLINKNFQEQLKKRVFNPIYFQQKLLINKTLSDFSNKKKQEGKNISNYKKATKIFSLFDIYGEIYIKNEK